MAVLARHRYRRQLDRIIADWVSFRTLAARPEGETLAADGELLRIKGRIAEGLTRVFERIPQQKAHDAASQRKGILDLLNQRVPAPAPADPEAAAPPAPSLPQDFRERWERGFLFLNQLKGISPVQGSARAFAPVKPTGRAANRFSAFLNHWFIRFVLIIAVLVAGLAVLTRILPWEKMGFDAPPQLGALRDAAGDAAGDLGRGSAGFLGGLFGPLRSIADPVFQQYGTEASIAMFTVLLLGIGYLVFIRSR